MAGARELERRRREGGDRRVRRACDDEGGTDFVPPAERVAVFDNDGTLWCEKPMPIELGFILAGSRRWQRPTVAARRQPWKAAHERDYAWLGEAVAKHYAGDDSDVRVLFGGILPAFAGKSVEEYEGRRRVSAHRVAPDARARLPRVRLHADGRAAWLPRGERVHELHRLGRRP